MTNRHAKMRIWLILPLVAGFVVRTDAQRNGRAAVPDSPEQPDAPPSKPFDQNRREPPVGTADMPADVRAGYRLFRVKCGECHSLNRRLAKADSSDDDWSDIVYRMKDMPSSHLNEAQTKAVLKFIIWDDRHHQKEGNDGKH